MKDLIQQCPADIQIEQKQGSGIQTTFSRTVSAADLPKLHAKAAGLGITLNFPGVEPGHEGTLVTALGDIDLINQL